VTAVTTGPFLVNCQNEIGKPDRALGEQLAELAKFAALLVFGALLTPMLISSIGLDGWWPCCP
jgi:sodium/hydrogen antiporter